MICPLSFPALLAATIRVCVAAVALGAMASADAAPTCDFRVAQPTTANFGAIDPRLATTATFTVTLQIKCTGGGGAVFSITGANDTGPGAYRLKHNTVAGEYMAYSVTTVIVADTSIQLNGQLLATTYQNAYFGPYSDTLTVLVTP
jgi:hypothetical protein